MIFRSACLSFSDRRAVLAVSTVGEKRRICAGRAAGSDARGCCGTFVCAAKLAATIDETNINEVHDLKNFMAIPLKKIKAPDDFLRSSQTSPSAALHVSGSTASLLRLRSM